MRETAAFVLSGLCECEEEDEDGGGGGRERSVDDVLNVCENQPERRVGISPMREVVDADVLVDE
jgi:hypothetical protein